MNTSSIQCLHCERKKQLETMISLRTHTSAERERGALDTQQMTLNIVMQL